MTIVYSQNFDSVTAPALPSGWVAQAGSTWTTTTTGAISSPNALIGAADSTDILYTGYTALANMEVRYDVNGFTSGTGFVAPILRAADDNNYYVFYPEFQGVINNTWNLYKKVAGSYTSAGTFTLSGKMGTGPINGEYSVRARIVGSNLYFKIWGYGATEPSAWDYTASDSSITAAGYPGFRYQFPASGGGTAVADNFTLDNTLGLAVSPTSVAASSTGNSLTLTGTSTSWTSGTPGSPTFTASSGTITAQTVASATSATLTFTAPSASGTVTLTDPSTSATAPLTITGGALSNGTLSSSSITSGSATVIDSGATGGTSPYSYQWYRSLLSGFTPGSGTVLSGATATTYNDTGLSASTTYYYKNIVSDAASGSATSSQLTVTTSASGSGSTTISVTNTGIYWSPGNWDHLTTGTFGVTTDEMQATAPGALFKTNVTGTVNLSILVDNATTSGFVSSGMPTLYWTLNNGPVTTVQLAPSQTSLSISSSLSSGASNFIEVGFEASSNSAGYGDVWGSSGVSPTNVWRVAGLTVDSGGSVSLPSTAPNGALMLVSDSIGAGEHNDPSYNGADHATASFGVGMARALGYELSNLSYGGQGFTVAGNSNIPALTATYNSYSSGRTRNWTGVSAIALVQGGNDAHASVSGATIQSAVQTLLPEFRTAIGTGKPIFVFVECMNVYASNIQAGVTAYIASSGDTNCYFINATTLLTECQFSITFGSETRYTYDSVHPLIIGHAQIAPAYSKLVGTTFASGTSAGYSRSAVVNA